MRLMQVNWGWPPRQTGGPVGYVADLSKELVRRGHQVSVFCAGDYDFRRVCRLSLREENRIELGSLVNSPNLIANSGSPIEECSHPVIEDMFVRFLELNRPQVVHFHSLIGLCGSLPGIAKSLGIPTVVSLHNYWFICPRSDFLRPPDWTLCPGPDAGDRCAQCISPPDSSAQRKALLRHRLKCLIKRSGPLKRLIQRGQMSFLRVAHSRLRTNDHCAAPVVSRDPCPEEISSHRYRRQFLKSQLTENADLIIAVSQAVKHQFVKHGIPGKKIRVLHSGLKQAQALEALSKQTDPVAGLPVRFGFFGPVLPYKGVHVLVEAFNRLTPASARLLIFGSGDVKYMVKLMKTANRFVKFKGTFRSLAQILPQFDVAVVPPIWHDNAPLVVLEALAARKPIIGARIGGIPDFVKHGHNGLLFKAGDADDLAGRMNELVQSPQTIERLRRNIQTPSTIEYHTQDMERIYEEMPDLTGVPKREDRHVAC
jgi:glycosyltransferase involved in cell wall biosynthesis